jgi:mono/diheme cytochrome c family protein
MIHAEPVGRLSDADRYRRCTGRAKPVGRGLLVTLLIMIGPVQEALASPSYSTFAPDLVERGRYLSVAGDCTGCHTRPGGRPFAGGYAIKSPMGPIYSSNITPSIVAGIGGYTRADFARAMRKGIRRDGAYLYPAMPYTAYQGLSDADVAALYAFFTVGVNRVDVPAPKTHLPFPFNLRVSMAGWNLFFLSDKRFAASPTRSAAWNRGAYLVGSLEHCSACHSPRGPLMNESSSHPFAGGSLGTWFAPNITTDTNAGIGAWSRADLVLYLKTGSTAHAQAAGGMAEAITNSLQHLTNTDIDAVATYIRSIAPVADAKQAGPRTAQGRPARYEPTLRGSPVTYQAAVPTGAQLYSGNCAACHGATGNGSKSSAFPSLHHNSATGDFRADNLIATILNGVQRDHSKQQSYMPGFGNSSPVQSLNDEEIAALSSYVIANMGDGFTKVSEADVALQRAGGSPPSIITAVRWGIPIAALVFFGLIVTLALRGRRSRVQRNLHPAR